MQLHSAHYMVTLCERILKSKEVKKLLLDEDANSKKQSIVYYIIFLPQCQFEELMAQISVSKRYELKLFQCL